jgi:nitrogen regulatory protein P-II 1
MKKIELIIPDSKLKDTHAILGNVNSGGMSYYTVEGSGTTQTQPEYIPRTKIDAIVKDDQVDELVSELTHKLGSELGGKIFVSDIPIAVDLRTKKTGIDAI